MSCWVFADSAGLDFPNYFSVELALNAILELRDAQLAITDFCILWNGKGLLTFAALELWELRTLGEKIVIGGFKAF